MSKYYEVTHKITKVYLVEVRDNEGADEAFSAAHDEAPSDDTECMDSEAVQITGDNGIDSSKRHCTRFLGL